MKAKQNLITIAVPVISILCAFIIGGIIIMCLGKNPFAAYGFLFSGAFGSGQKIAQTLGIACPLIFTSLAAAFAYRCGVFNLGGEGQFIMGACASMMFCSFTGMTGGAGLVLSLLAGILAGAFWGAVPGLLKIGRGLNEIIVSIMLNYVATLFMGYLFTNLLREGSTPQTAAVDDSLKLARLFDSFRIHWGILVAAALSVLMTCFIFRTSLGFKIRAVGMNAVAAGFNGFPVKLLILLSFVISGSVAGLGGSIELHGRQYRLMSGFGKGFGFDGVAIALIAQLHPLGAMLVAVFFAILRKGSSTLQTGMKIPTSVVDIIQALIIVFAVAGTAIARRDTVKRLIKKQFGGGKGAAEG